jgi:hypothetical protein
MNSVLGSCKSLAFQQAPIRHSSNTDEVPIQGEKKEEE